MLEALLESPVKEKVLLFLLANRDSYPSEIAGNFGFNLNAVQYQLQKLEKAGILYSQLRGKVRLYGLSPNYAFRRELEALLQKTFDSLGPEEKGRHYVRRVLPWQAQKSPGIPAAGPAPGADGRSRSQDRPETGEMLAKKESTAAKPQYLPKKAVDIDFSTD